MVKVKSGAWALIQQNEHVSKWARQLRLAKRVLGRPKEDGRLAKDVCQVPDGKVDDKGAFFEIDGERVEPEEVSAFILGSVRLAAERHAGYPVTGCVVAVPAYFTTLQRTATLDAAEIAGFERGKVKLVEEPVAAAIDYLMATNKAETEPQVDYLLVVDIGGGTMDITLVYPDLENANPKFLVKATAGDQFQGGMDIDQAIMTWAKEKAQPLEYEVDDCRLLRECEARKRDICRGDTTARVPIEMHSLGEALEPKIVYLTRSDFDGICKPMETVLLDQIDMAVLTSDPIDAILLVGGSSQLPFVKAACEDNFPDVRIVSPQTEECVARGAALLASNEKIQVKSVLPRSIAVQTTPGGDILEMTPVVTRNTPLPFKKSHMFGTNAENQSEVEIAMFEGEGPASEDNIRLTTFSITDIPPCGKGTEITFDISVSQECVITATANVEGKGAARIVEHPPRLEAEQIKLYHDKTIARLNQTPVVNITTKTPGEATSSGLISTSTTESMKEKGSDETAKEKPRELRSSSKHLHSPEQTSVSNKKGKTASDDPKNPDAGQAPAIPKVNRKCNTNGKKATKEIGDAGKQAGTTLAINPRPSKQ
ncbi:hypothetical protein G7046_g831 [Stylonectria norvegica]|nr:hypothetical protein G7046_g831 [Stylonectria norvegica]